jgi:hypothetical protein|nr:MAG TPA: hypothetical protein [Caudoviricetes sp.]
MTREDKEWHEIAKMNLEELVDFIHLTFWDYEETGNDKYLMQLKVAGHYLNRKALDIQLAEVFSLKNKGE